MTKPPSQQKLCCWVGKTSCNFRGQMQNLIRNITGDTKETNWLASKKSLKKLPTFYIEVLPAQRRLATSWLLPVLQLLLQYEYQML